MILHTHSEQCHCSLGNRYPIAATHTRVRTAYFNQTMCVMATWTFFFFLQAIAADSASVSVGFASLNLSGAILFAFHFVVTSNGAICYCAQRHFSKMGSTNKHARLHGFPSKSSTTLGQMHKYCLAVKPPEKLLKLSPFAPSLPLSSQFREDIKGSNKDFSAMVNPPTATFFSGPLQRPC